MKCLKCGRDIKNGQVFCAPCLEIMDKYPVEPVVSLRLPKREPPKKANVKKHINAAEDQIRRQHKTIRRLLIVIILLALSLCVVLGGIAYEQTLKNSEPTAPTQSQTPEPSEPQPSSDPSDPTAGNDLTSPT